MHSLLMAGVFFAEICCSVACVNDLSCGPASLSAPRGHMGVKIQRCCDQSDQTDRKDGRDS